MSHHRKHGWGRTAETDATVKILQDGVEPSMGMLAGVGIEVDLESGREQCSKPTSDAS